MSFKKNNPNIEIINLYDAFNSNSNYFEFGDTHWNSFGFNTTLLNFLDYLP